MKYKKLLKKSSCKSVTCPVPDFYRLAYSGSRYCRAEYGLDGKCGNGKRRRRCISCVVGCDDCGRVLVQDDFSAGDDQSGSGSTLADDSQASNGSVEDGDSQAGNGSAEGDDSQAGNGSTEDDAGQSGNASFTGMTDGNPSQSEDLSDGFSDGGTDELQEQDFGFGSMDPDSAEEEKNEDDLTDAEIEAQLEPIRELQPLSYVDPPAGNGNGDTGSVGAARAASYPAKYDPRSSLSIPGAEIKRPFQYVLGIHIGCQPGNLIFSGGSWAV